MKVAEMYTSRADPSQRLRDDELDLFGLTHPGSVRTENQDHFLVGTVHPEVIVHGTSLPDVNSLPLRGERLASLFLVADGVSGGDGGSDASRIAAETIARYVSSTLRSYHAAGTSDESKLLESLRAAALEAHRAVRAAATSRRDGHAMATTLTLGLVVWPWLYVVQLGDSRCYLLRNGELAQVTVDHTVSEIMVETGKMSREEAQHSPMGHALWNVLGGRSSELAVDVYKLTLECDDALLLCTDGLYNMVPHEALQELLASRQCLTLLLDARLLVVLALLDLG